CAGVVGVEVGGQAADGCQSGGVPGGVGALGKAGPGQSMFDRDDLLPAGAQVVGKGGEQPVVGDQAVTHRPPQAQVLLDADLQVGAHPNSPPLPASGVAGH